MRKTIGFVLLALGAALLAVGVVTTTWAPGVVKKTPLDVDTTTRLEGTAARLGAEARPIKIFSLTRTDSDASDDNNAVFVSVQCVTFTDEGDVPDCGDDAEAVDQTVDDAEGTDPRVLSITTDRFVTDRSSALSVAEDDYVPADRRGPVQHEGLVNKFPFGTEQTTYPYWDGLVGRAFDAEFVAEEQLEGLDVDHFRVTITDQPAEVATDTDGTYSNVIDIFVEPETGAIVQQTQDQQRSIDGEQVLSLQAAFTDEQVRTSVDEAQDNLARLHLVTRTMPLVGFIGGAILLLAGAALILLDRRRSTPAGPTESRREPVSAGH